MASKSKVAKAKRVPKYSTRLVRVVSCVAALGRFIENSGSAAFAFENWRIKELFQVSKGELVRDFKPMMTDPIADMLTRVRNAVRIERDHVEMPFSKVKRGVAEVLKREGYIWDWSEVEAKPVSQLRLELKYGPNGERVIRHIKRVSKPGRGIIVAPKSCSRY